MTVTPLPEQPQSPRVSIVVAAESPRQSLQVLVDVVERHPRRGSLEVLVVSPSGRVMDGLANKPAFVRFISAPVGAGAGELRANGIRHASGDVVIMLDGDRSIDEEYVDSLLSPTVNDANL